MRSPSSVFSSRPPPSNVCSHLMSLEWMSFWNDFSGKACHKSVLPPSNNSKTRKTGLTTEPLSQYFHSVFTFWGEKCSVNSSLFQKRKAPISLFWYLFQRVSKSRKQCNFLSGFSPQQAPYIWKWTEKWWPPLNLPLHGCWRDFRIEAQSQSCLKNGLL